MLSKKPAPDNKIYPTFVRFFNAYANFIKTGDPNHSNLGATWKTIGNLEPRGFTCMQFTDEGVKGVVAPNGEKFLAWDSIFEPEQLV